MPSISTPTEGFCGLQTGSAHRCLDLEKAAWLVPAAKLTLGRAQGPFKVLGLFGPEIVCAYHALVIELNSSCSRRSPITTISGRDSDPDAAVRKGCWYKQEVRWIRR